MLYYAQCFLDNFMLLTLQEQFENARFLFQHGCTSLQEGRSITAWRSEFGLEELDSQKSKPFFPSNISLKHTSGNMFEKSKNYK